MGEAQPHVSVMLNEVLAALRPVDGGVYVDGTFGAGGYSRAILDAADCTVIAIDRDSSAFKRADEFKEIYGDRLVFLHGCFGDVANLLENAGFDGVDGFVLDLGVSSMQLDEAERGFSFRYDAPLDMRMDQSADIPTAADIVREWPEKELADAIYRYGEERHSRRVARLIVQRRAEEDINTTGTLADIVRQAVPKSRKDDIHPATRTFQALRIVVNEELLELEKALEASESILNEGGRLVVVSFHSLEDGMVKRFMREHSGNVAKGSRYAPERPQEADVTFDLPTKKAIFPTEEETAVNPRSRSARLRLAVRTKRTAGSDAEQAGGRGI